MTRRSNKNGHKYEYDKAGAFGCFKSVNTEPVEYLLTTFSIDELHRLSYARDLHTELNFEYLIQRDIDEERALGEISQYISAGAGKKQKEIVFLPPLLVAVVSTDSNNNILPTYPACDFSESDDGHGNVFLREWPGLFKVENYEVQGGIKHQFSHMAGDDVRSLDGEQAKLHLNLSPKDSSGAKLVVIDGQHRLFALNYLRQQEPQTIDGLTLPVCIVYPPNSTEQNSCDTSFLKVPDVLRSLFVDVNSTVERVSGHFLTLLSDETLGSVICRDFCKTVLADMGEAGLGMVEWNTKNHKQSLEVSREHTITSIGVINSSLEENFKSKSGVKLLSDVLCIEGCSENFDFGEDEYSEKISLPSGFPWTGFSVSHKGFLGELVRENFTPYLVRLFFHPEPYKKTADLFSEKLQEVEDLLRSERSTDLQSFSSVRGHLLFNDPIKKGDKAGGRILSEFVAEYRAKRDLFLPAIFRKSIMQKAIIDSWVFLLQKLIPHSVSVSSVTDIVVSLVNNASSNRVDLFNLVNVYLQDTVFDGGRIKVTKSAKKQMSRLLVSQLGDGAFLDTLSTEGIIPEGLKKNLRDIAEVEVGGFYKAMCSDKRRVFEKSYKTNFSIPAVDRERLMLAEAKRSEKVTLGSDSEVSSQSSVDFEGLVDSYLKDDLQCAADNLIQKLKFNEFVLFSAEDVEEEL